MDIASERGPRAHPLGLERHQLDRRGSHSGTREDKPFRATHLFLTSLRTTPKALLRLMRDRLSLECWHWICDTQLQEDAHRYRGNDAGALACLRTAALNLLRLDGLHSIRSGLQAVCHDITALLALLNDGAIISIADDKVRFQEPPVRWTMQVVLGVSTTLGLVGMVSSFGLRFPEEMVFTLARDFILILLYLKLSVTEHLTVFAVRTCGPFWSVRPALVLLLALNGILMMSIVWPWTRLVWVWSGWGEEQPLARGRFRAGVVRRITLTIKGQDPVIQCVFLAALLESL